jgi:hypothetical protein
MDAGKVFVLLLIVFVFAVLAYIELKSRRSRQASSQPPEDELDPTEKTHRQH